MFHVASLSTETIVYKGLLLPAQLPLAVGAQRPRDLALGFVGPAAGALDQLGLVQDARGNVAVDARYATSIPHVFAAGDAKRGASLIVWAISEGREAARHVDAYLRRGASQLPAIGQDLRF